MRPKKITAQDCIEQVARGRPLRAAVEDFIRSFLAEDTDVGETDDKVGGDAAEELDDLLVGVEGPDPTDGATGSPPEGEAEGTGYEAGVVDDPADDEPGAAGAGVKSVPTDKGTDFDGAIETNRRRSRSIIAKYLGEKGDDDDDDDKDTDYKKKDKDDDKDVDEGKDDDDEKDDEKKKKKKDDDEGGDKEEESRRKKAGKPRGITEADGRIQDGCPVIATVDGAEMRGQVGESYDSSDGYIYQVEVEGRGNVMLTHLEVRPDPERAGLFGDVDPLPASGTST